MRLVVPVLALIALPPQSPAQTPAPPSTPADTAPPRGPFDGLRFRGIGPATMSGRIDDFAVLERDPRVFYIAAATGGLWKTENGGITLRPVFDSAGGSPSIGAVDIPAEDPNLVWVGTGENNNRQSSSWGDGVWKSTDGGRTWKHMGLRESRQVSRVLIDPVDHEVVYVAALGDLWKSGGERGIYKTTDGGLSWSRILDAGPDAGGTEIVMDPSNHKVLYAATYQRRRASFGFNGGGTGSGLWKSTDAGRTWTRLTRGIPAGPLGRIGIDVYRRNPNIVYARIEHEKETGLYRSDDAGFTWTKQGRTNPRPMYFGVVRVDPENDLRVYIPAVSLHVSDDGGKTFRGDGAQRIHVDFHAMWINPASPDHMMIGGDGGVGITFDRGKKWMWLPHLPVGQFYHVSYDMQDPYWLCGGLQDNDTWCGPSQVRSEEGIANDQWFVVQGGDGFVGLVDPTNPRIIYAESQDGFISRIDRETSESKGIRPEPPPGEKSFRWNWDTPLMLSHHDPATVYAGAQRLFKSADRGHSWTAISPDLTTGVDRDTMELMGQTLKDVKIARNDGVGAYATLFTIAESPRRAGLLYTGSDDGQVHVTRDGGATWANVTSKIPNAPRWAYVSKVVASRFEEGTAYASFDAHRTGDYGTYLYVSTDYGTSWRSIVSDSLRGQVVRTVTEDLRNPDVLYAGTETGLYVTVDRGRTWSRVRANLPPVPVYEITLHPRDNDMILATHGRALWILDDLTPFQEYARAAATDGHVFTSEGGVQRDKADDRMRFFEGDMAFLGENPAYGAWIAYHLRSKGDSARLVIRDAQGAQVREIKGEAFKDRLRPGINQVRWDLRAEPIAPPKGAPPSGGGFFDFAGPEGVPGPIVMPGDYRATLVVNGREVGSTPVPVRGDPVIQVSDADRRAHQDALRELQRLLGTVQEATHAVRTAGQQFAAAKKELSDTVKVPADVRARIDSLGATLDSLRKGFGVQEGEIDFFNFDFEEFRRNLNFRVGMVAGNLAGMLTRPSEQDLRDLASLRSDVPAAVDQVNAFLARLKPFYQDLATRGLYPPVPEAVKK